MARKPGSNVLGPEPDGPAEGAVHVEDLASEQRAIDRGVEVDVRFSGWEVGDLLNLLGSHRRDGDPEIEFLPDVHEQALMPGNDDIRRPRMRANPQHLELDRKQIRVALRLGDIRVNPVREGPDDLRTAQVVMVQLGFQIAAVPEQPRPPVSLQLTGTEDLGHGARGLPAPHFELEEAGSRAAL